MTKTIIVFLVLMLLVLSVSITASKESFPIDVKAYRFSCYLSGKGGYSVDGYYVTKDCQVTNQYAIAKADSLRGR